MTKIRNLTTSHMPDIIRRLSRLETRLTTASGQDQFTMRYRGTITSGSDANDYDTTCGFWHISAGNVSGVTNRPSWATGGSVLTVTVTGLSYVVQEWVLITATAGVRKGVRRRTYEGSWSAWAETT